MFKKQSAYLQGAYFSIATMHQKQKVIAPLFYEAWGAVAQVPQSLNTDALGTFSGEIEREGDMLSVVRKKCLLAMDLLNLDIGVASEGSFGAHPSLGFLPANTECMLFIDRKNGVEVLESVLSTETNFMGKYIETERELLAFAKTVGFPDHALILRSSKEGSGAIYKGIQTPEQLSHYFKEISQQYGTVFAETDMRALYNPTRMKIIEQCTRKLIQTIRCFCPACGAPGFGVTTSLSGLPCKLCATPTRSVLGYVRNCRQCGHTEETMYPNGKKYEDPMFCDCCNP